MIILEQIDCVSQFHPSTIKAFKQYQMVLTENWQTTTAIAQQLKEHPARVNRLLLRMPNVECKNPVGHNMGKMWRLKKD